MLPFLALAARTAKRSTHTSYTHAAIVVRGGAIVAVGFNSAMGHAEVRALRKLWPSKRAGVRVYSLRFTRTGRLAMAKPCAMCDAYMRGAGVKSVAWSTASGTIERMRLR